MKRCVLKLVSVTIALALLFAMGACELSANVMEECLKNTNQAQSMTYEINMTMGFSVMGQEIATKMQGEGRATSDPLRMEMALTQQTNGMALEMQSYSEMTDDEYTQYIHYNDQWVKQTLPAATISQDPMQAMSIYLDSIRRYQKEGEETVAGRTVSKYSAVISGEALERVMQASGMLDQLQQLGMEVEQAGDLYAGLGDLSVALWIDEATMMAAKIELDFADMMQTLINHIAQMQDMDPAAMGLFVNDSILSLTVTGYDNVDSIEIPQEAREQATDAGALS